MENHWAYMHVHNIQVYNMYSVGNFVGCYNFVTLVVKLAVIPRNYDSVHVYMYSQSTCMDEIGD